jgi:hypothetical protein
MHSEKKNEITCGQSKMIIYHHAEICERKNTIMP